MRWKLTEAISTLEQVEEQSSGTGQVLHHSKPAVRGTIALNNTLISLCQEALFTLQQILESVHGQRVKFLLQTPIA